MSVVLDELYVSFGGCGPPINGFGIELGLILNRIISG
jgi:hypothetical protein